MDNTTNITSEQDTNVLPHNIEVERTLLGTLLINNDAIHRIVEFLNPEHFYVKLHQDLFCQILHFTERGHAADPATLSYVMQNEEDIEHYLQELVSCSFGIIDTEKYGRIIEDLAVKRHIIEIASTMLNEASKTDSTLSGLEQIETVEQALFHLASNNGIQKNRIQTIRSVLDTTLATIQSTLKNKNDLNGISTGFADLDQLTAGLQKTDLIIVAGRPSMGKTAFAINLALNAAHAFKKRGAQEVQQENIMIFSLEMSSEQLAMRMLAQSSGINLKSMRHQLHDDEFEKVLDSVHILEKEPIFIDDSGGISIATLRTRVRRVKREYGVALLIVDYLQLLHGDRRRHDANRVQEISEITQSLKAIAKELNIPVIVLSQLSRAVEQRENKRPLLSDLRDSGSIEQDADIVLFLYREEYYIERQEPAPNSKEHDQWKEAMDRCMNITELIIAKQRNGPTGKVRLHFDAKLTRFSNLSLTNIQ